MDRLALFDIDGTLVNGWTIHKQSFGIVIKEIMGVDAQLSDVNYFGKVDRGVLYEILRLHKIPEREIDKNIDKILDGLANYYQKNYKLEKVQILPGVVELLDTLKKKKVALALTTGNLEKIAYLKLGLAGLEKYFPTGGFGNEAMNRWGCAEIAIQKAEKHYGISFAKKKIFMIGDTKIDIKTGTFEHIQSIGVATGGTSLDDLKSMKPDFLFKDFSNVDSVVKAITDD